MVDGLGSFVADSLDNSVAGGLDNSLTDGLDNSKVSDLYSSSAAGSVNATMTIHLNQLGQLLIQPGKLGQHLVKLGQDTRRIQILFHVYGDMLISRCWDHTSRGGEHISRHWNHTSMCGDIISRYEVMLTTAHLQEMLGSRQQMWRLHLQTQRA